jgi:glycosyltransferase involved in cell wall biosynthesis
MPKPELPKNLNICLIAKRFPILSRTTDHGFLWPIARGLAELGHRVTVLSYKSNIGKSEIFRDNVQVYFLAENSSSGAFQLNRSFEDLILVKFQKLHEQLPFHIVHSIDKSAIKIAKMRRHLNVAVAYDADATQMSQIVSILGMAHESVGGILSTAIAVVYKFLSTYYGGDKSLLKTADGIFVSTPQQKMMLEREYLYPDYHMYTVPYGLEIGNLSPKEQESTLRQSLRISESSKVAVTLSDMTDTGEVLSLLKAFEKVAIKKPNAYLIIVGQGPKFKEIEYNVLSLALGRKVLMVGAIKDSEIRDYISLANVFVNLSSRTTGFEPSMIEAMAQKIVVIGSEVSAIANIIEDSIDGFLIRPADSNSLSQLMIEIFSEHLPTEEIGEKARQKVMRIFDPKQMVLTTLSAYRSILLNAGVFITPKNHSKKQTGIDATS